jgi:branched-chain amino acid transport system permease protein
MELSTFITLLANGLAQGAVLFLLASGLTLIFGFLNVVNFAHGAFFLAGAYLAVWLTGHTNIATGIVGAIVGTAAIGLVVEAGLLRRLYRERTVRDAHLRQLLLTLGVSLVITEVVQALAGPDLVPAARLGWAAHVVSIGGGYVQAYRLILIAVALAVFLAGDWALRRTRMGLIVRAGVQDREMVQSLGIKVSRSFAIMFTLGAALAGLAGAAALYYNSGAHIDLGANYLVLVMAVVVAGGLGSFTGSAVSATAIGLLGSFVSYSWPQGQAVVMLLLPLALLLWRPLGLFGTSVERV